MANAKLSILWPLRTARSHSYPRSRSQAHRQVRQQVLWHVWHALTAAAADAPLPAAVAEAAALVAPAEEAAAAAAEAALPAALALTATLTETEELPKEDHQSKIRRSLIAVQDKLWQYRNL